MMTQIRRADGSTADDPYSRLEALRDAKRPDRCPPHLVHPRYLDWEVTGLDDYEAIVRCANLCGWAAPMKPQRAG